MATRYASRAGTALGQNVGLRPTGSGEEALPHIPGVNHGGKDALIKRAESSFYAFTKQGGGLLAIWWALTHPTGWVEWSGFLVFYVLGVLSITLCYHRHFCHKTFDTSTPMRYVLGIWGQLGAYGSMLKWCIDHRRHHARADKTGDLHSPLYDGYGRPLTGLAGFRHSHIGWLFDDATTDHDVYGKGLVDDPVVLFCHRTRVFWFVISILLIPAVWGWAFGGPKAITGTILIAGCLRMALSLQFIAMVNSVCHRWGTQRFSGQGLAKNNAIVAILTCGEGWHNNHHAHPRSANFGMAWYEIDVCHWVICLFEKMGLVWNVNRVMPDDMPRGRALPQAAPAELQHAN
jgi:stearoyl-CoA desaturase (delta-9 desaturase)